MPMSKLIVTAQSGSTVNMRVQPTTTSKIIQAIPLATEVELVEKTSSTWYKIRYEDKEGYMMAKFLKQKQSTVSQEDLRSVYNSLSETLTLIEKILK